MGANASTNAQGSSADFSGVDYTSKLLFDNVDWFDMANENPYFDSNGALISRGDMLAFARGDYYHYALYMGRGAVVHVTMDPKGQGWVLAQALEHVRKNSKVTIQNCDAVAKTKYNADPRTFREIFDTLPIVGEKIKYDLFKKNCEHYCTLWRYGVSFSLQVHSKLGVSYRN